MSSDKPIIITGPGWYITRNGKRVNIDYHNPDSGYTFCSKGIIYIREFPQSRKTEWSTWKLNGQNRAIGEHPWDIVEAVSASRRTNPILPKE